MFGIKLKPIISGEILINYIKKETMQRFLIVAITVVIAFLIIQNGSIPKQYKLSLGEKSPFDINAPRDIENKMKTEQNALAAAAAIPPVTKEINSKTVDILNNLDNFYTVLDEAVDRVDKNLQDLGITNKSKGYKRQLEAEQVKAAKGLSVEIKKLNIKLSDEQTAYLLSKVDDEEMARFKWLIKEYISDAVRNGITQENLNDIVDEIQDYLQNTELSQDMKNIGELVVKTVLEPNRTIDNEKTNELRHKESLSSRHREMIYKDARIISVGDIVTEDILKVLNDLDLLDTSTQFDFLHAGSIMAVLLLLAFSLILFMKNFCREILNNTSEIILICAIITLTLIIALFVKHYTPLAIPVFIAAMLIAILVDLELACAVNCVLVVAIMLLTNGDMKFMYMAFIGGCFSAFLVAKVNQRSKLSMAGIIMGFINVLIIACIGMLNKTEFSLLVNEGLIVFLNGIISIILTLGLLPFIESTFNVITPIKLLELTNPNQPLLKRLLMEAPGTYHHSLMVGNLAEEAAEAINGNSLLARVGAYFHDVGKLKRPGFFKENQMSENPHDKMTANLSTLVITSHTQDGVELSESYKIPSTIRNIIKQHHGTTPVAYFYHKAKKQEKSENVKLENFRYDGPKPTTKESAVVMLADSVEAAVRSMTDKTEGKIEGLVRKIIKDKLDDGQLDLCNLTLKDLDNIAKGFIRVFSGFFHGREQYPDVKMNMITKDNNIKENMDDIDDIYYADDEIAEEMLNNSKEKEITNEGYYR